MFDDRDRRPPEERPPIREPKPDTSPQRDYGDQGRRIEQGEGDRLPGTDPNQN